jgi:hypothetical protein
MNDKIVNSFLVLDHILNVPADKPLIYAAKPLQLIIFYMTHKASTFHFSDHIGFFFY